jgi:hypothetical protein
MGQAGMLSTDGKCFTFDKRANGIVPPASRANPPALRDKY